MRGLGLFLGLKRQTGGGAPPPPPTITGVGYVGYTLTASAGSTYQWQRNGVDIPLATASTYVVTLADEGEQIRCVVDGVPSNVIEQWVLSDVAAYGATLEEWFDAEDSSTVTIATGVSAWAGKGTVPDVLAQVTASRQPTYEAAGFNARPCLSFDHTLDQFLDDTTTRDRLRNAGAAIMVASLQSPLQGGRRSNVALLQVAAGSRTIGFTYNGFTDELYGNARRVSADGDAQSDPIAQSANPAAVVFAWDILNASCVLRQDGVAVADAAISTAGLTENIPSEEFQIGGFNGSFSFNDWTGKLHEIAVISGSVSTALQEKLDGYLAWRGRTVSALDAGSPYKLAPPSPPVASVITGTGYVGYTLTASAGSAYQWQRNGVDIGGATASTYVVTLADEGEQIRCVVDGVPSNVIEQWVPTDAGTVGGWWDAYSPTTITIATGVSQWDSRGSYTPGEVAQATGGKQPGYSATGWDGVRPCLSFDGANHALLNASAAPFGNNAPGVVIAAAATATSTAADREIATLTNNSASPYRSSLRAGAGGAASHIGRRLDIDAETASASRAYTTGTRLFGVRVEHTNDRTDVFIDGAGNGWSSPYLGAGNTSPTNGAARCIGARPFGDARYWFGKIAEVVYYDQVISDANLDKLNGYLAWRWGVTANLPGGHPHKTEAPTP